MILLCNIAKIIPPLTLLLLVSLALLGPIPAFARRDKGPVVKPQDDIRRIKKSPERGICLTVI